MLGPMRPLIPAGAASEIGQIPIAAVSSNSTGAIGVSVRARAAVAVQAAPGSVVATINPAARTRSAQAIQGANAAGGTTGDIAPVVRTRSAQAIQGVAGASTGSIGPANRARAAQAIQAQAGGANAGISPAGRARAPQAIQGANFTAPPPPRRLVGVVRPGLATSPRTGLAAVSGPGLQVTT